jgi:hypothetical protein
MLTGPLTPEMFVSPLPCTILTGPLMLWTCTAPSKPLPVTKGRSEGWATFSPLAPWTKFGPRPSASPTLRGPLIELAEMLA